MLIMAVLVLVACSSTPAPGPVVPPTPNTTAVTIITYASLALGMATRIGLPFIPAGVGVDVSMGISAVCLLQPSANATSAATDALSAFFQKVWTAFNNLPGPVGSEIVSAINFLWGYLQTVIGDTGNNAALAVIYYQCFIDNFCKGWTGGTSTEPLPLMTSANADALLESGVVPGSHHIYELSVCGLRKIQ